MDKNTLFNIIININEITTKNLKNNGVSPYFVAKFVKERTLRRVSKGKYEIYNINELYSYGKKLIHLGYFNDAIKCFLKCIDYDKNDVKLYFQLMIVNILIENYNEVLKYLDYLTDLGVIVENERTYMLYLLSNVTNLNDNYLNEIENLMFDSIRYINYEDQNAYKENKVRGFCFKKKFAVALENQKKMSRSKAASNYTVIHNLLITKSFIKVKTNAKIMYDLIQREEYYKVKEMLDAEINPSIYNIYVGKLLDEIIFMNSSNYLPKTNMIDASSVFEAIDGKNYSLALSLNCKRDEEINNESNLIGVLLKVICNKIKERVNPVIEDKKDFSFNYFSEINRDTYFEVEKILDRILNILMKKQGIYIMESFNDKTTYDLLDILSLYPNIKTSLIKYNLEKRIVIRYSPEKKEELEEKPNLDYASILFDYKYYDECLDVCLKLLQNDSPSLGVYILTARTYLKLKDSKEARKYFMIVYDKTKNTDYLELINHISSSYLKPTFNFKLSEFYDKTKKK